MRWPTGPTPNPPAETRIVNRPSSSPCLRRIARLSLRTAKTGSIGMPETVVSGSATPSAFRWTLVSSRATKYCSACGQSHMACTSKSVTTTEFKTLIFPAPFSQEMIPDGRKWVQIATSG